MVAQAVELLPINFFKLKFADEIPNLIHQSDSMEDEADIYEGVRAQFPLSSVVSALAVDHTGSRVLSGSYDSQCHQIRGLSWSPTADRFMCVTGSTQAKIYDHDGLTLGEFVKGDMNIRDLGNTKGHISGLTCGEWHPKCFNFLVAHSFVVEL
ncbi:hypothetical protein SASPL_137788 [Salvia splendens]|uniref:Uncharacterized protein n=1 Tax=Salvia splendens TaxID=180675 RepID=A0A8X8WTH8_SALSN|nr:hypothetical protein SASPL_137788 [Salvia splendens]